MSALKQQHRNLLKLRDKEKARQQIEAKTRDAKRKANVRAELRGGELWNGGV